MIQKSAEKNSHASYVFCVVATLALACFIRGYHFFQNYSLWLDELMLATSLLDRDYLELANNLEYGQGAPPLFLILSKLCLAVFGIHDWALKLPSHLVSIVCCIQFWRLCEQRLSKYFAAIALLLFCLNPQVLSYSQIFKPYIYDVLATILLCGAYSRLLSKPDNNSAYWLFALYGAIALWVSYPSIIVLAALGSVAALSFMLQKQFTELIKCIAVIAVWIISFIALYVLNISQAMGIGDQSFWQPGFLNWSDGIHGLTTWISNMTVNITLLGTFPQVVTFILMVLGLIHYIRTKNSDLLGLLAILLVSLIFSALNLYSIYNRASLFLVPVILLISCHGLQQLLQWCKLSSPSAFKLTAILILVLVYPSATKMGRSIEVQEMRQAVEVLKSQLDETTQVFVFSDAIPGVQFYGPSLGVDTTGFEEFSSPTIHSLYKASSGQQSTTPQIICIWGRNYKIASDTDFQNLFNTLNQNQIYYEYYAFKNAHVLVSAAQYTIESGE